MTAYTITYSIYLISSIDYMPKIKNTATITIDAAVNKPAVDLMPWATASSVFIPRSTA